MWSLLGDTGSTGFCQQDLGSEQNTQSFPTRIWHSGPLNVGTGGRKVTILGKNFPLLDLAVGCAGGFGENVCCEKLTPKPEDRGRENHEPSLLWGWFNQMPGGKYGSQIGLCLEMDDINVTHCTKEGKTSLTGSDYNSLSSGPQSLRKLWVSQRNQSLQSSG